MTAPSGFDAAVAQLTGPGGPFEFETVDGPAGPVRNFARRERSIRELIDGSARRGDAEFLVQGERRLSFADFAGLVRGTASALVDRLGLQPRDRVAVAGSNGIEWLLAAFAAAGAGGVAVVLNHHWTSDELAFALDDSGARILVADADVAQRVAPVADGRVVLVMGQGEPPGSSLFADLQGRAEDWPQTDIRETDPFVIMYTSGTTGRPKGCITTHQGTLAQVRSVILNTVLERTLARSAPSRPAASAAAVSDGGRPKRQPVLLETSPLFHVSGLHAAICLSLLTGTKVVMPAGRFDPAEVLRLIEEERITAWGAVPTMIHRVVDCPDLAWRDLSSLESVAIGGAPLPPDVLARAQRRLPAKTSLGNGYGLTETHGAVTMNAGRGLIDRPTSVGRPSPLVDVRIVGEDGVLRAIGEVGEVQVRGVVLAPGYWNRPAANAEAFADGWFRTGDLGFFDGDGYLHLADRLKDMIIRGGENVYCVEVEDALCAAPEVDEAAVFGLPDPDLGERVAAVVVLTAGASIDERSLREFVAGRLARYKVPERIVVTGEALPRSATGKILKGELRDRHGAVLAGGG